MKQLILFFLVAVIACNNAEQSKPAQHPRLNDPYPGIEYDSIHRGDRLDTLYDGGQMTIFQSPESMLKLRDSIERAKSKPMYTDLTSFDLILAAHNMTPEQFEEKTTSWPRGAKADYRIELIAAAINRPQGDEKEWKADVVNRPGEYRYFPYFWSSGSGLSFFVTAYADSHTAVASRLTYRDRARARFAGQTFLAEYTEYITASSF